MNQGFKLPNMGANHMCLTFMKKFLENEPNFSMRNFLIFFIFLRNSSVEAFLSNISGKQNVLFIIGDDLRPTIGAYGDRTPFKNQKKF